MATNLQTNLLAYYKFDESNGNAADSKGSATLTNTGTITYSAGKLNNGANLVAASSQYFTGGDTVKLTSDFSVSMWLKPTSLASTNYLFSKFNDDTSQRSFYAKLDASGNLTVVIRQTSNMSAGITTGIVTGSYQHLVITYTASTHTIQAFVNNVSKGTADITATSIDASTAAFEIGSLISSGQNPSYTGQIDEMGVWTRVLDSTNISDLYNGGNALGYPLGASISASEVAGIPVDSASVAAKAKINASEVSGIPIESSKVKYGWQNQSKNSSTWTNRKKS